MTTAILHTPHSPAPSSPAPYGRQSTRLGAGLGIAGIVLIVAGFALIAPAGATVTSTAAEITAFYTDASPSRVLAGGLLECAGFLLFLAFATMLTGRLRGPGATGELLPDTARLAAAGYVTICLVPGMAAGAVALWLAHRGTPDPDLLLALNALRGFCYFIALLFLATFLVLVGISAIASRRLPRWAAWSAVAIGVPLAATVPVATTEIPDMFGLLALAWVVSVGVALARRPEPAARG